MPVYEFECPEGTITEKLVGMDTKQINCPNCGQRAKKIMSPCTFELKGGGWYADGYSSTKKTTQNKKSSSD
ncbi:MAG: zinc ribbon domain-containing protein [Deltaproteobacteria bacterium]|nr:MAG: zinc ribbon domain-containing protein [Deltaproteobacteria bacterium]